MKYVLVNGSPRGEDSVTLMIARTFLEGTGATNVSEIDMTKHPIQPCRGCMACWKTHGDCIIKGDDMCDLWKRQIYGAGDPLTVVWSFPLYVFGIPSNLKAFFDRRFSFTEASQTETSTGGPTHPIRADITMPNMRNILVSSCGFYTVKQNYEGLIEQFKHTVGEENYERILMPMAGAVQHMKGTPPLENYLALVRKAGSEFERNGAFAQETRDQLAKPILPEEQYLSIVNKWAASL